MFRKVDNGEDCKEFIEAVRFWQWFYTSDVARKVVEASSFANIPSLMTPSILRRMATELTCNGVAVGESIDPDQIRVVGGGSDITSRLIRLLGQGYESLQPDPFEYTSMTVADDILSCNTTNKQFSLTSSCEAGTVTNWGIDEAAPKTRSMLSLPFVLFRLVPIVATEVAAVCEGKLNLTELVVANIYLGTISTWDDAKLVALNPGCNFTALTSPQLTLVYMDNEHEATFLLTGFLSAASTAFSRKHGQSAVLDLAKLPRASQRTFAVPVQAQVEGAVIGLTGAFALIPLAGALVAKAAQITLPDPSLATSMTDCLSKDPAGCMPLTSVMSLNFVQDYYGSAECGHARSLVKFLQWIFLGVTGSSTVDWLEVHGGLVRESGLLPASPLNVTVLEEIRRITCDGKLLSKFVFEELPESAGVAGAVVAGSGVLASATGVVFVIRYWKTPVVFSAAPLLLCAVAVGCMITYCSILMRAFDLCGMNQALYSLGYSVVLAAFYVKSYRIDCVFNSSGLGLPKSATPKELNKRFALVMLVEVLFEVASLVIFPVNLEIRVKSALNEAALCNVPLEVITIFGVRKLFLIGLNIYYAYKVRNVNSAFNEAKIIAFCVYNVGFFICLWVPLALIFTDPVVSFALQGITIWVSTTATIGTLFGYKMYVAIMTPQSNTMAALSGGQFGQKGVKGSGAYTRTHTQTHTHPHTHTHTHT
jgi:hypothetical protein